MISFEPLWKTLKSRNLNKTELQKMTALSSATIAKLSKNESVTLDVVDRICGALECDISDVVDSIPGVASDASENAHIGSNGRNAPIHASAGNGSEDVKI